MLALPYVLREAVIIYEEPALAELEDTVEHIFQASAFAGNLGVSDGHLPDDGLVIVSGFHTNNDSSLIPWAVCLCDKTTHSVYGKQVARYVAMLADNRYDIAIVLELAIKVRDAFQDQFEFPLDIKAWCFDANLGVFHPPQ